MQLTIHAIINAMQDHTHLKCDEKYSERSGPDIDEKINKEPTGQLIITWPRKKRDIVKSLETTKPQGFEPIGDYSFLRIHVHYIPHNGGLMMTIGEASNDAAFGDLFSMVYFLLELQNRTLWMLPATNDTTMTSFASRMLQNSSEWGVPYMEAKETTLRHTPKGKQFMLCAKTLSYDRVCKTAVDWLPLSPHMQYCEKLVGTHSDTQKLAFMLRMRRVIVHTIDRKYSCKLSEDAGSVEHNDIHDVMFVSNFINRHPLHTESAVKRQKPHVQT